MTKLTQIIVSIVILVFVILLLLLAGVPASTSIECLTREQAKQRWPNSHLYWHGVAHCWDTRSKHWPRHQDEPPPHKPKIPIGINDGVPIVMEDEFNLLDAQAGSRATWPREFEPWSTRVNGIFREQ